MQVRELGEECVGDDRGAQKQLRPQVSRRQGWPRQAALRLRTGTFRLAESNDQMGEGVTSSGGNTDEKLKAHMG